MNGGDFSRKLKQNCNFRINQIDYARVIATRVYNRSMKNTLKEFIRMCVFDYDFRIIEKSQSDVLCTYSYRGKGRMDYDDIFDKFCSFVDNRCDKVEFIYRKRVRYIFLKLFYAVKYYFALKRWKVDNPLYVAIVLAQFLRYEAIINKKIVWKKYSLMVSFCDAHGVENMMAQIARNHNVKTATLQHGQYRTLKRQTENADVEAYENFVSDYLLAWGEKTREEFVKGGINRERILLVGALKPFSYNQREENDGILNVFGVVLNGNVYEKNNLRMISYANKLAEKYNLRYVLRLHPQNSEDTYLSQCDSRFLLKKINCTENVDYMRMVDFSLVHMSGVFVELLSINSPIFVMNDVFLEDIFKLKGATFSNEDELYSLYKRFRCDSKVFKEEQYGVYRQFNQYGDLQTNYLQAIDFIMKGDGNCEE